MPDNQRDAAAMSLSDGIRADLAGPIGEMFAQKPSEFDDDPAPEADAGQNDDTPDDPASGAGASAEPNDEAAPAAKPTGKANPTSPPQDQKAGASTSDADAAKDQAAKPDAQAVPEKGLAPEHWEKGDKEAFAKLPKEAQAMVRGMAERMDKAHHERTRALAPMRAIAERFAPLHADLEPYRSQLALQGVDEGTFMRSLLAAHTMLVQKPVEAIRYIASRYQIDLAKAAGNPTHQLTDEDATDPILSRFKSIEERIAARDQADQAAQRAAHAAAIEQGKKSVISFIEAKDDKGQLLHPHWAEVEKDVLILARGLTAGGEPLDAAKLDDLYARACRAHPEIGAKMIAEKAAAERAKAQAEAKRQRDASTTSKVTSAANGKVAPNDDFRTALARNMRAAGITV